VGIGAMTAGMTAGTAATIAGIGGAEPLASPRRPPFRRSRDMSWLLRPEVVSSPDHAPRRF